MSYFGQQPLAALKPLFSGQNLADLANKATSRANLDVFSKTETLLHAVPIGTIIPYWGNTAPAGYLPCFGQSINSTTFPELVEFLNPGQTSATVPDFRGEFLRGWDSGRGVDTGRTIKSGQLDSFQGHKFYLESATGTDRIYNSTTYSTGPTVNGSAMGAAGAQNGFATRTTDAISDGVNGSPRTASETRPRNVAVLYCIKAYGSITDTTTANMAGALSLVTTAAQMSQFENLLSTNGYQKLPGGLIIQWGVVANVTNETVTTVTFPISFTASVFSLSATGRRNTPITGGNTTFYMSEIDLTSAALVNDSSSGAAMGASWIAIGY